MKIKKIILVVLAFLMLCVPVYAEAERGATPEVIRSQSKVSKPLKGISLSKTNLYLNKGEIKTIKVSYSPLDTTDAKGVIWTSTNNKVAYVSGGRIKGMGPGTCYITAKCGNKTAKCKVTVKAPITRIDLDITKKTIPIGGNFGITVTFWPGNTTDSKTAIWKSSNPKVATVYGHKAGKATITAKMGSQTAVCEVTVKYVAPKYVSVSECYTIANTYRVKAGLGKYTKDAQLEKIAKVRAKELAERMAKYGEKAFEHETYYVYTRGIFVKTNKVRRSNLLIKDVKGDVYRGENIAYGQDSCKAVMTAWYSSKGHRDNMLKKQHKRIGIAGYKYENKIYWVMILSS